MGFGLVLIGYFFMLNLPVGGIDILPDIVGCLIMLSGVSKLILHCRDNNGFAYSRLVLYASAVLSIVILGCQFAETSGMLTEWLKQYFYKPMSFLYTAAIGLFHVTFFVGIFKLAKEVGLPKIANRSRRMLVLTLLYYICEFLSVTGITNIISSLSESHDMVLSYINLTIYILGSLWMLFTFALILTCYMRICLEGDEDMPYRENSHDQIVKYLKSKKKKK